MTDSRLIISLVFFLLGCSGSGDLRFEEFQDEIRLYNGANLITSYHYADSLQKQSLYPIKLPSGTIFTRRFPLITTEGESTDHPHHIGLWFSYGEVNDIDFWTTTWENFDGINPRYGKIVPEQYTYQILDNQKGVLETTATWQNLNRQILLKQKTKMLFDVRRDQMFIDFDIMLYALENVHFKDSKEGLFAIRVADCLREDATGSYLNSKGMVGEEEVWGKQSKWMALRSKANKVSVILIDHPDNLPAYWMARGYGLFSINPLGKAVYEHSADSLNLTLNMGESIGFRYRVILTDKYLSKKEINKLSEDFLR